MVKVTFYRIKLKAKVWKPKAALWISEKFSSKAKSTDEKNPKKSKGKVDDDVSDYEIFG